MHAVACCVEPRCGSLQCQDSPGLWLHGQQPSHPTGQAADLPMQRSRAAPAFHPRNICLLFSICKAHLSASEGARSHCQFLVSVVELAQLKGRFNVISALWFASTFSCQGTQWLPKWWQEDWAHLSHPRCGLDPQGKGTLLILMALFNSPKEGLPPTPRTHTTQNHLSLSLVVFLDHSIPLADECVSPFREASLGAKCSSGFDSHRTGQES